MLTGGLFYLISSHLELMSSLCQRGDGAVNKKVEEQTTRDRGKKTSNRDCVSRGFQNTKASIRIGALICQDLSSWCNRSDS